LIGSKNQLTEIIVNNGLLTILHGIAISVLCKLPQKELLQLEVQLQYQISEIIASTKYQHVFQTNEFYGDERCKLYSSTTIVPPTHPPEK